MVFKINSKIVAENLHWKVGIPTYWCFKGLKVEKFFKENIWWGKVSAVVACRQLCTAAFEMISLYTNDIIKDWSRLLYHVPSKPKPQKAEPLKCLLCGKRMKKVHQKCISVQYLRCPGGQYILKNPSLFWDAINAASEIECGSYKIDGWVIFSCRDI